MKPMTQKWHQNDYPVLLGIQQNFVHIVYILDMTEKSLIRCVRTVINPVTIPL